MTETVMTLGGFLETVEDHPWDYFVCVPTDYKLEGGSLVQLVPESEIFDEDGADFALSPEGDRLVLLLGVADFQSIVSNLRSQNPSPDQATLMDAVRYYLEYDAYLQLK